LEPLVPIIPDHFVNSVIYLYPTHEDADRGTRYGGSGCLVAIPVEHPELDPRKKHIYAVSASHVVCDAPVMRFNRRLGGIGVYAATADQWRPSPFGDDLAVVEVNIDFGLVTSAGLGLNSFITPEQFAAKTYGLGNECLMIGRYIDIDGAAVENRPVARFGNLARTQTQRITRDDGALQESFLVEMRSLSGFSGSPTWIWDDGFEIYTQQNEGEPELLTPGRYAALLGIDWCHLPYYSEVQRGSRKDAHATDYWISQNSGMAGVVPAWHIRELLEEQEMKDRRREVEEEVLKGQRDA
jgi:hypothetical protein